jgi:hypothetical protein
MRGHLSILEALDRWAEPNTTPAVLFEITMVELNRVIVGWSCMGNYVFGEADLRDILSYDEARQLLRKVAYNSYVEPDEKKSLE